MTLEIVSWNVNGLRRLDDKWKIRRQIGSPQIACLQEVWRKDDAEWFKQRRQGWGWWFKASGWVWRLFQRSGLLILSHDKPLRKRGWSFETPLGLLLRGSKFDWIASKGMTMCEYRWGRVVNLHLDAGGEPEDITARDYQLRKVEKVLAKHTGGSLPLIVVGDFNLSRKRPWDAARLASLLSAFNLRIAVREHSDGKGMILYRGCEVIEAVSEPHDGLSDHPRLRAQFRL